jgi:tetraacyldisaccharide 4'-kinase
MQTRFERTENYLISLINQPEPKPIRSRRAKALLWALKLLSHLYGFLVQIRLFLYAKGIWQPHELGCQVISVGNLTVGGTGKTPVVEVFARELARQGRKVAILSRGYKKQEAGTGTRFLNWVSFREHTQPPRVVSDGKQLLLNSSMSGDEPYMLASNLPDVAVLVDKNRVKSGRYAINRLGCDTLILDDGFQYLALRHRVEVLLVDRTNPFGNGHVLPRGILREPVRNLAKADFVFLTKSNGRNSEAVRQQVRSLNPRAEIIECRHCPRYLKNLFTDEQIDLKSIEGMRIVVVSGIAAPAGFEDSLRSMGAELLECYRFADHHRYQQQEIIDLVNDAERLGAQGIVTTEKDAVRFPRLDRRDVPIYFLRVDIEILSGEEDFHECIQRICFRSDSQRRTPETSAAALQEATAS